MFPKPGAQTRLLKPARHTELMTLEVCCMWLYSYNTQPPLERVTHRVEKRKKSYGTQTKRKNKLADHQGCEYSRRCSGSPTCNSRAKLKQGISHRTIVFLFFVGTSSPVVHRGDQSSSHTSCRIVMLANSVRNTRF